MGAGLAGNSHPDEDRSGERLATCVRRGRARLLHGFAAATRELLGDEAHARVLRAIPHVVESVEADIDAWVSIDHIADYCEAAYRELTEEQLRNVARVVVDSGLPRAKLLLLAVATPHGFLRRGSEMFREDFTDGRLIGFATSPCSGVITIYEHRFNESPLLRAVAVALLRYMLELSGATDVLAEHELDDEGALVMRFTWS